MSLEVLNPEGGRCFNFGVDENGRAECHWPACGCTPTARKTTFLAVTKGVPASVAARAMTNLCSPIQVNWRGCSKSYMAESFSTGGTTQAKDAVFLRSLTIEELSAAIQNAIKASMAKLGTVAE